MKKNKKAAFIVSEYNENVFYGSREKVNYYIILELIRRNYTVDIFADNSYIKESRLVNFHIKDKKFNRICKKITAKQFIFDCNINIANHFCFIN